MSRGQTRFKVDVDASTAEHYQGIRSRGQQYLVQACRQILPGPARQRIVQAALEYMDSRSGERKPYVAPSQSSQNPQISQGTAAITRDATFQSHLTALIDGEIPAHALVSACVKAADIGLLPVLTKCLEVVARIGHIRELKTINGELIVSQSQYQDDELVPVASSSPNQGRQQDLQVRTALPEDAEGASKIPVRRTGQNFVDEFISKLVDPPSTSGLSQSRCSDVFVVSASREAPLTEHAAERVLNILTDRMVRVEIFELPAFVYQLLLFASTKGKEVVKNRVLLRIAEVFSEHEQNVRKSSALSQSLLEEDEDAIIVNSISLNDLREVQGTALYHIDIATRQDPSLASEVIKLVKSGVEGSRHFLSSFGTGIVLLLARSTFLRNDVLFLLREAIVRFDKERSIRVDNMFAARVAMNDDELLNPQNSLCRIADSTSENGWDYVKEGLLELSLVVLDKPLPLKGASHSQSLAMILMSKLFNSHPEMRQEILSQLHYRIALQDKSALHAVRIVKSLSEAYSYTMLEHHSFIRDCIELLVNLPQWLASPLMDIFKPLFELRQDLLDFFYLVVRKSFFYKDSSSRAVAIIGFLTIASMSRETSSRSRASQALSQDPQQDDEGAVNALLDIIQPLRRTFSFPPVLRAFLYKSVVIHVHSLVSSNNTAIMASALGSLLLNHFHQFVDIGKPPYLLLERCIVDDAGTLQEPVGDLIWCLAALELKRAPGEYHKSYVMDLAKKVASVSLQDFPFSKGPLTSTEDETEGTSQPGQSVALGNRNKTRLLGSIVEALIHSAIITPKRHFNWDLVTVVIVPLLLFKSKIFDLLHKAGVSTPGDAFRDLGGDLDLERLRPGGRFVFQRSSKASGASKKSTGPKKGKSGDQTVSANSHHSTGHRFGVFNILTSAYMKPSLSLEACISVLDMMSETANESQDDGNPFSGQSETQDFQEFRIYLMSVAHRHVDEFVQTMSKWSLEEPEKTPQDIMEMATAVETLVRIAMNDFKNFRRASGEVAGQGGLKALQISESCAAALPLLCQNDDAFAASFCKAILPLTANSVFNNDCGTCETATNALEQLVESLLGESLMKEGIVVLRIHYHLIKSIVEILGTVEKKSTFLTKRAQWAAELISSKAISDAAIVKALIDLTLIYTQNNNDMRFGEEICERLLDIFADCNTGAEPPGSRESDNRQLVKAKAIQRDTFLPTVDVVCDVIERGVSDSEWCLGRMISLEAFLDTYFESDALTGSTRKVSEKEKILHEKTAKLAIRAEDAAQTRLTGTMRTLRGLFRCAIAKWNQQERLLKVTTKVYKLLAVATHAQLKRRGDPRTSFVAMIAEGKVLSPTLSESYMFIEANAMTDGGAAGASRAKTEGRMKAQLVYDEEKFYQQLIAAQKKTKINLLRGMRRSTARDFRIREDKLRQEDDEADGQNEHNTGHHEHYDGSGNEAARSSRQRQLENNSNVNRVKRRRK